LQGLVQSLEQALLSSELLAAPGLLELAVQYELHDLVANIASLPAHDSVTPANVLAVRELPRYCYT